MTTEEIKKELEHRISSLNNIDSYTLKVQDEILMRNQLLIIQALSHILTKLEEK